MLTTVTIVLALMVTFFLVGCCQLALARAQYWAPHVALVREGGYVPPQPSIMTALLMRAVCILLGFLEVGPIRISGRNRVPEHGPMIIAPFHIDTGDGSIISAMLGIKPMYYMIRTTEVVGLRGWMATLTSRSLWTRRVRKAGPKR
ncbi:MAG: hypothetical protein K2X93_19470 [Candidatus Obscuribacterales bacterium]|nr:hypothetical protein [Candidatus Obscuribacterales bacterium]